MNANYLRRVGARLEEFNRYCFAKLGRSERRDALSQYVRGLLLEGERKSIYPIACRLADCDERVQGVRQSLQQAVSVADWDERIVFQRIAERISEGLPKIEAFVVDDTGFPKKGRCSVGVQRQYSGTMGRVDNCQIATSLHLASEAGGACIGMRLYLPQIWANSESRRLKTGIPESTSFKEKWRIALELIDDALAWELPKRAVATDAGYGDSSDFRSGLKSRGLKYIVGVTGTAMVWPPGVCPKPPPKRKPRQMGRTRTKWTPPKNGKPLSMTDLAANLPRSAYRKVTWRTGSRGPQSSRFAVVRIRTARRHTMGNPPGDEQWLLCEWPARAERPTTFYLSNLPKRTSRKRLVYLAKIRWRIERDYQEMKSQLGLDHFEGRSWRGFHHHAACVAAAHAFLTIERALFPPKQQATHVSGVSAASAARPA
jgi:SRSO17 transposase